MGVNDGNYCILGAQFLLGSLLLPFMKVVKVLGSCCQQLGLCCSAHPYLVSGEKCHSWADALQNFCKVLPILHCSLVRYLWNQRWSLCAQYFYLLGLLRLPLPPLSKGDLWQDGLFPDAWLVCTQALLHITKSPLHQ